MDITGLTKHFRAWYKIYGGTQLMLVQQNCLALKEFTTQQMKKEYTNNIQ